MVGRCQAVHCNTEAVTGQMKYRKQFSIILILTWFTQMSMREDRKHKDTIWNQHQDPMMNDQSVHLYKYD